ncbi:MAG: hypothetical protein A3K68_01530 [Euryarchaeota archaeon RBG_16_68_13]|nr:MAG: hypothetical protein A3K68_01530 [Euryarchaeota archaeon RBG_16_68_13]
MTHRTREISLLLLVVAALVVSGPAAAPPPVPMRVSGTAFDAGGSPLPVGTTILAFVDGVAVSNPLTVTAAGGSFVVLVEGNPTTGTGASETPEVKEGADPGEAVLFAAGALTDAIALFQEAVPWQEGAEPSLDLNLADPAKTPEPLKIQGLIPEPALDGNQSLLVCNPTSGAVSASDYFIELNRPGTVHGPRFNLSGSIPAGGQLEVDFGSTPFLRPAGDAVKLVYRNPGGPGAPAVDDDIVVDRVEFNATVDGTLFWEPGNTLLEDAPAPGPGRILERTVFCADTNRASDFRLAVQPGLPPNEAPAVAISSPAEGATVPAGQLFTFAWTMSDDLFRADQLRVWVNVTYAGTSAVLLAGSLGPTSISWAVPNLDARGSLVTVDVVDPLGARTSALRTFHIAGPDPFAGYGLYVAFLVIAVLVAFVVWGYRRASRLTEPPRRPPATSPPPAPPEPPADTTATDKAEGKKPCPRCGTSVDERDWVCFFCGFRFPGPPT